VPINLDIDGADGYYYCNMKARRIVLNILFFLLGLLLVGSATHAVSQVSVSDALAQLSSANVRGFVQPMVEGFGASLNSGLYPTPGLPREGFHARLSIVGSGTLVDEAQRYYDATPPEGFGEAPVRTATILGGTGTTIAGPGGVEYQFQNGQIRVDLFGMGTPQLSIGTLFGTEAIVRYAVAPSVRDFPRTSLVGYGLRHSVSQYFPSVPVELSVGAFRQELSVGDVLGVKSTNVALMVGKSISLFNLYGGVQYESTAIDVDYAYTGYGSTEETTVNLRYSAGDVFRWTTGFSMNVMGLSLGTELGVGNVTSVTGTIGIGF
jgi:hypothetical protein